MSKFGESMRGLTVFISDIRNCKSKEAERKRINKELANIRSKFKSDKIEGYQKKKYVCKLLFMFLLGNDINFGYQEAVNLLSSIKFTEKQIGYLFVSVVMNEGHELMPLVIQSIRHDLESNNPTFNTLSMQCIANVASKEMVEQLGKDVVPNLIVSPDSNGPVKQTACLCLLKLLRVDPSVIPVEKHASRIIKFLNDKHLGLVTAACSLLEELAHTHHEHFKLAGVEAIQKLSSIVSKSHSDLQDYSYYFVPAPWLSVKLMKLIQCYPVPADAISKARLVEALDAILNRAAEPSKSKKVQHSNAKHAVLFEAVNLIVHMESESNLQVRACNLLGGYLTHKETNMRYLSLEGLCSLSTTEFSREAVRKHQDTVLNALKTEKDVSVRQKAIDLLYAMCDHSNSETIVAELLQYLEKADYSIREPLVLKIAILSEKYAQDYTWYVDTILKLIRLAGDYVSEEVWYRIIQIVINKQEVQGYAAKTCFESLQAPACHENMIKVGGYILGEFGNLIAGDSRSAPMIQFELLHNKFPFCSIGTRALLLSTYIKFINLYPEIKAHIQAVFEQDTQSRNADLEIQQRAIEYLKLSHLATTDLMATILEEMPQFPEKDSLLLSKLFKSAPWMAKLHDPKEGMAAAPSSDKISHPKPDVPAPAISTAKQSGGDQGGLADLLGIAPEVTSADTIYATVTKPVSHSTVPPTTTPQSHPSPHPPAASNGFDDFLVEMPPSSAMPQLSPGAEEGFKRFACKNSGVLFENQTLQIGLKSEFKQNLARIGVFFGNKSNSNLVGFTSDVIVPPAIEDIDSSIKVHTKPVPSAVDGGAQIQQMISIEVFKAFFEPPLLNVKLTVGGIPQSLVMKLPLLVHKLSEPADMAAADFFQRWKNLPSADEAQKVFAAQFPIDKESVETKLKGCQLSVLNGVDPNPDNFVSAGVLNTKKSLIGVLLRLEPNKQDKKYRLTIRSSHKEVSRQLLELLSEQF